MDSSKGFITWASNSLGCITPARDSSKCQKLLKKSLLNQKLSWNVANIFQFKKKNWHKISPQKGICIRNVLNFFCIHVKFHSRQKGWLGFWSSVLGPLNIGVHISYCLLRRRWWGCFKNTGWWWCHVAHPYLTSQMRFWDILRPTLTRS